MNSNQPEMVKTQKTFLNINFYLIINLSLVLVFPTVCTFLTSFFGKENISIQLFLKWFIFWAVGIRLFTAGIKQASDPTFTAKKIFKINDEESYVIIRELGFANISLGVMAIFSLINNAWRPRVAVCCSLFFGLAALQHLYGKPVNKNRMIAFMYDVIVFIVLVAYLILMMQ